MSELKFEIGKEYTFDELEKHCAFDEETECDSDWDLQETGTGRTIGTYIIILQHCEKDKQMIFVLTGTRGDHFIFKYVHESK